MKNNDLISDLSALERLAKTLADARDLVKERVNSLHDELEATKNRRLPGLKSAVVAAVEAESMLYAAIKAAPEHFTDPRTMIVHGMRIGYAKGRGKIVWDDEATVVSRIEKMFPDQASVLIKTVKTLRKKALNGLKADELRKVGCTVIAAGDFVYIAPVADDVDKLVTRLLKQETPESED